MFGVFYFGEQYFSESFPFDFAPPPTPTPETFTYQQIVISCGYKSCGDAGDFSSYNLQDGSETTTNSSSLCSTRTCSDILDVDIYNVQNGSEIVLDSSTTCETRTCNVQPDIEIYSLQDALYFNGTPLTVIVQCPPGYICPDGSTPYTFTYPPGSFYFPKPPTGGGGCGDPLQVQGCESLISRDIPCGSSSSYVDKVVDGMLQEMAEQSARCCVLGSIAILPLTFNDNVSNWVCAGSEFEAVISARTYFFRVPNPSLWPVEDYNFPNDDQPIWMSAGLLPPAGNLGPDSTYYGVRLALSGTVPLTTGTFEFSVSAFAPGPREIIKGVALCPGGTFFETNVLVQDPPAIGTKKYVIEIIGITTGSPLPNAVPEQEYTQYFAATGFGAVPNWGLAYGSLPDWMYFNTYAGVIYGTPPIEEDGEVYTFAIFAQQDDRQCVKEFTLTVKTPCPIWNNIVWGSPVIVTAENGTGSGSGSGSGASIISSVGAWSGSGPANTSDVNLSGTLVTQCPTSNLCCITSFLQATPSLQKQAVVQLYVNGLLVYQRAVLPASPSIGDGTFTVPSGSSTILIQLGATAGSGAPLPANSIANSTYVSCSVAMCP